MSRARGHLARPRRTNVVVVRELKGEGMRRWSSFFSNVCCKHIFRRVGVENVFV